MRKTIIAAGLLFLTGALFFPLAAGAKTLGASGLNYRVTLVSDTTVKRWETDTPPTVDTTGDQLVVKFVTKQRKEVYIIAPKNLIIEEE